MNTNDQLSATPAEATSPTPPELGAVPGSDPLVVQCFVDSSWCNDGTPNHDWSKWEHIIENGRIMGGEAVCAKCGMGAMHYSLMVGP